MTRSEKIGLGYRIFLGVFTFALGVLLVVGACELFFSEGGFPYEEVQARLKLLLAPFLLWAIAVAAGFVLADLFPARIQKRKRGAFSVYRRLISRLPAKAEGENARLLVRLRNGERLLWGIRAFCAAFCLLAAGMGIAYLCDPSHFGSAAGAADDAIALLQNVFPWVAAAFVLLCGAAAFESVYAKKTLPSIKRLLAAERGDELSRLARARAAAEGAIGSRWMLLALRVAAGAVGVILLVVGIVEWDGVRAVLQKAIMICTQCIGLG